MEKQALHSLVKKAAHNAYRKSVLKGRIKRAFSLNPPSGGLNNAAMGAVLGGLTGLGAEAFSGKRDKSYLKSMILSALIGGGLGFASSYAGAPDMWKKTKPYLVAGKNRVAGAFNGAANR